MCFLFYNNSPKVCCNQWHICEICSTIYFLIASLQPCKYHMAVHNVLCAKIVNSSVIRQKGESQNGCFKKTKHTKFSKKPNISYPLNAHVFSSIWTEYGEILVSEYGGILVLFTWNIRFEIRPFALLPTNWEYCYMKSRHCICIALQIRCCVCNVFLMSFHSCKYDVRQDNKFDVVNLLLKRPEKRYRYCNIFSTLYRRCCVCWDNSQRESS